MNSSALKILIVGPDISAMGGISNYYRLYFKYFVSSVFELAHFENGTRTNDDRNKQSALRYIWLYLKDFFCFVHVLLVDRRIHVVQFNPSMIPVPVVRDGLMHLTAKLLGRKTILFFRGWDKNFVECVNRRPLPQKAMAWMCRRADRVIILADRFKDALVDWGVLGDRIIKSWTTFDGELVRPPDPDKGNTVRFLFLSRFEEDKGIFEIIQAAALLMREGGAFHLTMVGFCKDETCRSTLHKRIESLGIVDSVSVKNYLDGKDKYTEFARSDVFLFPSVHPEGCPNAVLEAMGSGLFIISTDVGALKELITDGENGLIVKPKDAKELAGKMGYAIENIGLIREKGRLNIGYAFETFEIRQIVRQFKGIYASILNGFPE